MPQMSGSAFALFLLGGLWLALWRGRARLLGLLPAGFGLPWWVGLVAGAAVLTFALRVFGSKSEPT